LCVVEFIIAQPNEILTIENEREDASQTPSPNPSPLYEQLEYLVHIYRCKGGFIIFGC
jgi:hypothetical protein